MRVDQKAPRNTPGHPTPQATNPRQWVRQHATVLPPTARMYSVAEKDGRVGCCESDILVYRIQEEEI